MNGRSQHRARQVEKRPQKAYFHTLKPSARKTPASNRQNLEVVEQLYTSVGGREKTR